MDVLFLGLPWYRESDYPAIVELFRNDGRRMPATYGEWLKKAIAAQKANEIPGRKVIRAYIDPKIFPAWCALNHRDVDARARLAWAGMVAAEVQSGRRQEET